MSNAREEEQRGRRSGRENDISHGAIRREVLSEAFQHPATLLPLAAAFLTGIYLLLFSVSLAGLAVLAAALLLTAGAFSWRYVLRFNDEYYRKSREIMASQAEQAKSQEEEDLAQLRESLRQGFQELDHSGGIRALDDLERERDALGPLVDRLLDEGSLSISHIPAMMDETYRQGLNVLDDALRLIRAIHTSDRERLETELGELEEEVRAMEGDESQAERLRIKQATIDSHRERLELLDRHQVRVDELLQQADSCEASLYKARIELAALSTEGSSGSVTEVRDGLQQTIDRAKRLQEEFNKLGL